MVTDRETGVGERSGPSLDEKISSLASHHLQVVMQEIERMLGRARGQRAPEPTSRAGADHTGSGTGKDFAARAARLWRCSRFIADLLLWKCG